jgi:hypothetical protein
VDEPAGADLSQQEHRLTGHEPLAVLHHTSRDVEIRTGVSTPNDFLTRADRTKRRHQDRRRAWP